MKKFLVVLSLLVLSSEVFADEFSGKYTFDGGSATVASADGVYAITISIPSMGNPETETLRPATDKEKTQLVGDTKANIIVGKEAAVIHTLEPSKGRDAGYFIMLGFIPVPATKTE